MEEISKLKVVYRVYESSDGILNCEKYPIIYANDKYLYYKSVRKEQLTMEEMRCVYHTFNKQDLIDCSSSKFNRLYFEVDKESLKEMQTMTLIRGKEYKLKELQEKRISLLRQEKELSFKIDELSVEIEKHKINLPKM